MSPEERQARIAELAREIKGNPLAVLNRVLEGQAQTDAYLAVYKNVKKRVTAEACCSKLLSVAKHREYIELHQEQASQTVAERLNITEERILRSLSELAFANVQDLFDDEGNLQAVHTLPREVAASLQSLKIRKEVSKDKDDEPSTDTFIIEVKPYDKRQTLVQLGKHIGMFVEKVEHDVADPLAEALEFVRESNATRSLLPSEQ